MSARVIGALLLLLNIAGCSTMANLYDPSGASQSNRYRGAFTHEKLSTYRQCANMARSWNEIDGCMAAHGYPVDTR